MITITSISPNHINETIQKTAIDSWLNLGMKVYSLNNAKEIGILKNKYPNVNFVDTIRTMQNIYSKPCISISAMIDFAKGFNENCCFINSDIELVNDKRLLSTIQDWLKTSVVVCNRVDYNEKKDEGDFYLNGFDVFFLNRKHLDIFPQSLMTMGQCFWDYWIPYKAITSKLEVVLLQNKFAFHKKHTVQYSHENWQRAGRYFLIENDLLRYDHINGIGQMSTYVYNFIYSYINKKLL